MLILNRSTGQRIFIGDNIVITIVRASGFQVRIGIDAPKNVPVHREEVAQRIAYQAEGEGRGLADRVRGHQAG